MHLAIATDRDMLSAIWNRVKETFRRAADNCGFTGTVTSRLVAHLGERADRPISEVTERDLLSLRNKLAEKLSPQMSSVESKPATFLNK